MYIRVARWYIFKPKIPIWVNFGGPWIGKRWPSGNLVVIWSIFPRLVSCVNKKSGNPYVDVALKNDHD
jgi:hypothetical protein